GATYDPATMTVTLPLGFSVPNNTRLELQLNEATDVPGAGVGISDLLGNLLDGNNDGRPGGSFTAKVVAQPAHQAVAKPASHKAKPAAKHPVKVTVAKGHPTGKVSTSAR